LKEDDWLTSLTAAYWSYWLLSHGTRKERVQADGWFWAWEKVEEALEAPAPEAFEILLALVGTAPNDDALAAIGAGPLEDLLSWHAANFVDRVEESARRDPAFRKALASVWLSEAVPPDVRQRLTRLMPPSGEK
jgi:hypothetical protein